MSIPPFTLQSLIPIVALEDSQPANSPQSPAQQQQGMTTFLRRSNNGGGSGTGTAGVRLAGGIGRGNRENPRVTIDCVEAWNATLSMYSLPDMAPLPPNAFPQIKAVTCFCHNIALEGAVDTNGLVQLCVMKKRAIHILTIAPDRATESLYIHGGNNPIYVAYQFGRYVCVADGREYKIIDLQDKKMVPVAVYNDRSQERINNPVTPVRPLITVVADREFLAFGQFVTFSGEPTRGVLTWTSFPRAIGVEFPYVVTLLRNNSIEIHNSVNQKLVQIIQINPSVEPRTISHGSGVRLLVAELLQKLSWVPLRLHKDDEESTEAEETKKGQADEAMDQENNKIIKKISVVPAQVILGGKDSIMALANTPLIVQADQLLDAHRVEEALNWAEQSRQNAAPDMHDERMQHELSYVYQRAGLIFLGATLLDDALQTFEKGRIDPRLIIHLFKDFQKFVDDESIYVYRGVKDLVERLGTIEDIVSRSLSKNYDPHIKPSASTAPETQELRRTLVFNAKATLQKFLAKDRANRTWGHRLLNDADKKILKAVDNALVKLYAESNSREPLNALLENENFCLLEWCEQVLLDTKKFYALSLLYKSHEKWRKTMDTWQRILTDELPDNDFQNGLKRMGDLLSQLDDADLVWEYASWVMLKDEIIGAKIFIRDPRKPLLVEPAKVLNGLQAVGQIGLKLYLEYLVIQRRSEDKAHHTELVKLHISEILKLIQKGDGKEQITAAATGFAQAKKVSGITFVKYLASQPPEDKMSQARSKLLVLLQTSTHYDPQLVLDKLLEVDSLRIEMALVYGKLNEHEKALYILIDELEDYKAAELYCLYAGRTVSSVSKKDKKYLEDKSLTDTRKKLFLLLLEVYLKMKDRDGMIERTIQLLNTQAVYLDVVEVLALLPDIWSIEMLQEFLVRSLRQSHHEYRSEQILKGICRGENTLVKHELFKAREEIGPVVITTNLSCAICQNLISDSVFIRQPNSDIVHLHCGQNPGTRAEN
ncbi:2611_t:CDS:10 [Paraglomus brasilianum]|uniref:2611_t:CDS:1 n=1 Tax=Paraglomus brasilianum TaxID=144538 RepID=A0A9N9B7D0_9GLOM|nr:2611_t:CDS:10 [Paraglomus brasilianum]